MQWAKIRTRSSCHHTTRAMTDCRWTNRTVMLGFRLHPSKRENILLLRVGSSENKCERGVSRCTEIVIIVSRLNCLAWQAIIFMSCWLTHPPSHPLPTHTAPHLPPCLGRCPWVMLHGLDHGWPGYGCMGGYKNLGSTKRHNGRPVFRLANANKMGTGGATSGYACGAGTGTGTGALLYYHFQPPKPGSWVVSSVIDQPPFLLRVNTEQYSPDVLTDGRYYSDVLREFERSSVRLGWAGRGGARLR